MARLRVGLDIGSTAVRAAEVSLGGDAPTLTRAAQVALPAGVVEDGEVRDADTVADALRDLWKRGGFRSKHVTMGVGNQRVVVREVTVPALPPNELQESLPFQVEELIPIPIEEAVLDHDVLEELEQEGRSMLRLLVVAAQRDMIDNLVAAATKARLDPIGVDLIPFALVRAVGTTDGLGLEESDAGGEALIDVGADVTNICVHERGVSRFVRILPSGGNDITAGVATQLGVTLDQAEALKRGEAVEGGPAPAEARPVAESRSNALVDEIRSSLDFYQAQSPGARVTRVLVTGGGSKVPGLLQQISQSVRAEVEPGHAFAKVRAQLKMDEVTMAEAEPLLAVAVGLALPAEAGS